MENSARPTRWILLFLWASVAFNDSPCIALPDRQLSNRGHTSDNLALIDVSGYLEYADGSDPYNAKAASKRKHVPLNFERFNREILDMRNNSQILSLEADSAIINLNIYKINMGFQVQSIDVSLKVSNYGSYSCKVKDVTPTIIQISESHFREGGLFYRCVDLVRESGFGQVVNKDIVYLVFNQLEFEIYGDPQMISRDEFSTPYTFNMYLRSYV